MEGPDYINTHAGPIEATVRGDPHPSPSSGPPTATGLHDDPQFCLFFA
jgi:hypothetical protein